MVFIFSSTYELKFSIDIVFLLSMGFCEINPHIIKTIYINVYLIEKKYAHGLRTVAFHWGYRQILI